MTQEQAATLTRMGRHSVQRYETGGRAKAWAATLGARSTEERNGRSKWRSGFTTVLIGPASSANAASPSPL